MHCNLKAAQCHTSRSGFIYHTHNAITLLQHPFDVATLISPHSGTEASIIGGRWAQAPQCFMWSGPTVKWAHPIFNTSEIAYGMCKTFLGCLCCSRSSVFHVVFNVVACSVANCWLSKVARLFFQATILSVFGLSPIRHPSPPPAFPQNNPDLEPNFQKIFFKKIIL